MRRRFIEELRFAVEIVPDFHSHYNTRENLTSLIDRVWCLSPPWLFDRLKANVFREEDPVDLSHRGVSDHAPWTVAFDSTPVIPRDARVILPHVGRTPGYKKLVSDLVAVANLPALSPQAALLKYKEILREAARLLRNRSWAKKTQQKRRVSHRACCLAGSLAQR